ncbi:MAG: U32 family peptidase [Desulfobacterales bacterium]|nr:U32 family peptidase [Desulfobacterales bacterium]
MAAACPPGLGLEVFIHGALCYGVSGPLLLEQLPGRQERAARPLRAALPPDLQPRTGWRPAAVFLPGPEPGRPGQGADGHPADPRPGRSRAARRARTTSITW